MNDRIIVTALFVTLPSVGFLLWYICTDISSGFNIHNDKIFSANEALSSDFPRQVKGLFADTASRVMFVHRSWKTEQLPQRFQLWSASWKTCFPNASHILWTDKDNRDLIALYYPWFLKTFDSLPTDIHKADTVRYFYLYHFGGIYTDLDNECLRPFERLLVNESVVVSAMDFPTSERLVYIQNSFIYSAPRHPMWLEVIAYIQDSTSFGNVDASVGSGALNSVIMKYMRRFNGSHGIQIYPPRYFNPFSWKTNKNKNCKHFDRMSDRELMKCRESFLKSSYVVQYHAHTWGVGKIL